MVGYNSQKKTVVPKLRLSSDFVLLAVPNLSAVSRFDYSTAEKGLRDPGITKFRIY